MNNWKIGTRIAAGFAMVILIAATLGMFAYLKVGTIERSSGQIVENSLPRIYLVGQLQSGVLAQYALLLQHSASSDKDEMAGIETEIQAKRARIVGIITEYAKLIASDSKRALFESLTSSRAAYAAAVDDVLKVNRLGTAEPEGNTMEQIPAPAESTLRRLS